MLCYFLIYKMILGHIVDNIHLLECHHIQKRSTEPHHEHHSKIESHRLVKSADQQKVLTRKKRQLNMFGGSQGMFGGQYGGGQYGGQDPLTARRQKSQQNYAPQEHYVDLKHLNDDRY